MATSPADKKIDRLYAGLGRAEIRRMMAKLSREHKPDEMNRLARAIAQEHTQLYNDGLKLLRVVNGNALDWIALFRTSMERDRFRMQSFVREAFFSSHLEYQFLRLWELIPYPVTESEYQAILTREWEEPLSLDGYAEILSDLESDEPGLHPAIAEYLGSLPEDVERERRDFDALPVTNDELQEDIRRGDIIEKGIRAIIDDAIKKGELPKPKRKDGELSLPYGVLREWGEGITKENHNIGSPGLHVPMLRLFNGEMGPEWDIRPDSEAEAVKERRRDILARFPALPGAPDEPRASIESLEPPLTKKELEKSEKRTQELAERWSQEPALAELVYDAAVAHADSRYQLAGLREALVIIQEADFFGEDPLFPEIRAQLDTAQTEADRFPALWEQANDTWLHLRPWLYKLQGIEPPDWKSDDSEKPAPIPEKQPNTEEMLQLIRTWGD